MNSGDASAVANGTVIVPPPGRTVPSVAGQTHRRGRPGSLRDRTGAQGYAPQCGRRRDCRVRPARDAPRDPASVPIAHVALFVFEGEGIVCGRGYFEGQVT